MRGVLMILSAHEKSSGLTTHEKFEIGMGLLWSCISISFQLHLFRRIGAPDVWLWYWSSHQGCLFWKPKSCQAAWNRFYQLLLIWLSEPYFTSPRNFRDKKLWLVRCKVCHCKSTSTWKHSHGARPYPIISWAM